MMVSFALRTVPPISRGYLPVAGLFLFFGLCFGREVLRIVSRGGKYSLFPRRKLLFVTGEDPDASQLSPVLRELRLLDNIVGKLGDPADSLSLPSLGNLSELEAIVEQNQIECLVIDHTSIDTKTVFAVITKCHRLKIDYKILPVYAQLFATEYEIEMLGAIAVLSPKHLNIKKWHNQIAKRTLDIIGSIIGLIFSAPLMILFAIVIRKTSTGPMLFRQVRYGLDGSTFTLYKLRTMSEHHTTQQKSPETEVGEWLEASRRLQKEEVSSEHRSDARIEPFGAFLRRWNFDEMPQFWNVLCGSMSLVGPRPEQVPHVSLLADEIPHYHIRHLVRPGMTGWAQVHGLRGGSSDFFRRVRMDLYYVEQWSIWLDFQIIGQTILYILRRPTHL